MTWLKSLKQYILKCKICYFGLLGLLYKVKYCLSGEEEYCELDVFQPSCADNEVVVMKSAFYGRMALGRCIRQDYGHIGCKADVLAIMDGFCSGRKICSVKPINEVLVSSKSGVCPQDMNGYLTASYQCIKGRYCIIF